METIQTNKLTMYLAVEGICDASTASWQAVQAFADSYADLQIRVTNIQTFAQSQTQKTTGITQDKAAARKAMCAAALSVANAVHAYAVKTKNNTLAAFNLLISKPRDTRAQGKTVTGTLKTEFDAADEDLNIMDDLCGQIADAKFVADYNNAWIVVDTAASHASPNAPAAAKSGTASTPKV
jgi:hypothetical protein